MIGRLSDADILAIKGLIESGRLVPPYTEASLLRLLPKERASAVSSGLQALASKGASPVLVAEFLGALHDQRLAAVHEDDLIELVWTGPEIAESPLRDTSVVVRELFRTAKEKIIVAGFAVYEGKQVFAELAKRMTEIPALDVSLFLNVHRPPGETTSPDSILSRFSKDFRKRHWPESRLPKVYYDPRSLETNSDARANMHAKCVVTDNRRAFVTSANFTEAAQRKNVEVGVLVNSTAFAKKLGSQFESLARTAHFLRVPGI